MSSAVLRRIFQRTTPPSLEPAYMEHQFPASRRAISMLLPLAGTAALVFLLLSADAEHWYQGLRRTPVLLAVACIVAAALLLPRTRDTHQLSLVGFTLMVALVAIFNFMAWGDEKVALLMFPQLMLWPVIVASQVLLLRSCVMVIGLSGLGSAAMLGSVHLQPGVWFVIALYTLALTGVDLALFRMADATRRRNFMASIQLDNSSMYEEGLGVLTRRRFFVALADLAQECAAAGRSMSLCVFDIDQMRQINANEGYATGDAVILVLLEAMRRFPALGPNGAMPVVIGRLSGDEFAVALPNRDLQAAQTLAADYVARVRQSKPAKQPVSVSVGVTRFDPGQTLDDVLQAAQERLNDAKRHGGNRWA